MLVEHVEDRDFSPRKRDLFEVLLMSGDYELLKQL